jgi:hypothetical protein
LKKSEIYKYPRNILIPVVLLLIGMVVVFVVYKMSSQPIVETPELNSSIKLPINTRADFRIDASAKLGDEDEEQTNVNFTGDSGLNIDISNGKIIVETLELQAEKIDFPEYKLVTTPVTINLNSQYPSTGEIRLDTGEIDLSLDMILAFSIQKENGKFIPVDINMTVPFSGTIDRNSGIIKLSGEATIPPDKLLTPLPVCVGVIATTSPREEQSVDDK